MATISRTRISSKLYSIRWRIVLVYMLIVLTAFSLMAVSLIRFVGEALFAQRIRDDQRIAEALCAQIGDPLVALDVPSLRALTLDAIDPSEGRILITDRYGVIQFDTHSELSGTRFANREVANILSGADADYGFYNTADVTDFWLRSALMMFANVRSMSGLFAHSIVSEGRCIGVLVYICSVQEIYESLRSIQLRIMLTMIVVVGLVLIVGLWMMRGVTGPIGELSEGIRKMTGGNLKARVNVRGRNEFSELARAFNSMSEKIEALDNTRSQFVSNASHELKTPLSTMKILIESLLYQDPPEPEMVKEFLGDVNAEIDRLNRVVSDLLTLVNIDSRGAGLNLSTLKLNVLLGEQIKRLLPLARENGIEINLEMREEISISADAVKLQQVIYNVLDNAIKYTPRGGEVNTTLMRRGKRAIIQIADTGIGIPAEHLPHIFDRFYRVDKARSRATGGTGLGLSIVKQIIVQHGGSIVATSKEGKGTCFEIELPIQT